MNRRITVLVDSNGQVQVEAHNYQGGRCVQATLPLKQKLIGDLPDVSVKKPEFNQPDMKIGVRMREAE